MTEDQAATFWIDLLDVSFSKGFYDAGGVKTRVIEAGNAASPPLILLHGVNGHAEAYSRNFQAHAERFHVLALDMIGHGFSDKPLDRDYEIGTYVQHLLDFMDALDLDRVYLSGESLGGWVAAKFVLEHPDRVERLVLNTPGGMNADAVVMERLKRLTLEAITPPTREKVRKRLEWLFKYPERVTADLVETRFRIYSQPGYREVTEKILCLQKMDIRQRNVLTEEELERISVPTLLVWTTADPVAGLDVARWCQRVIPNSRLIVFEDSAHWPQFEEPDAFNRLHMEFLTE